MNADARSVQLPAVGARVRRQFLVKLRQVSWYYGTVVRHKGPRRKDGTRLLVIKFDDYAEDCQLYEYKPADVELVSMPIATPIADAAGGVHARKARDASDPGKAVAVRTAVGRGGSAAASSRKRALAWEDVETLEDGFTIKSRKLQPSDPLWHAIHPLVQAQPHGTQLQTHDAQPRTRGLQLQPSAQLLSPACIVVRLHGRPALRIASKAVDGALAARAARRSVAGQSARGPGRDRPNGGKAGRHWRKGKPSTTAKQAFKAERPNPAAEQSSSKAEQRSTEAEQPKAEQPKAEHPDTSATQTAPRAAPIASRTAAAAPPLAKPSPARPAPWPPLSVPPRLTPGDGNGAMKTTEDAAAASGANDASRESKPAATPKRRASKAASSMGSPNSSAASPKLNARVTPKRRAGSASALATQASALAARARAEGDAAEQLWPVPPAGESSEPSAGESSESELPARPPAGESSESELPARPPAGESSESELPAQPPAGESSESELHAQPPAGESSESELPAQPPAGESSESELSTQPPAGEPASESNELLTQQPAGEPASKSNELPTQPPDGEPSELPVQPPVGEPPAESPDPTEHLSSQSPEPAPVELASIDDKFAKLIELGYLGGLDPIGSKLFDGILEIRESKARPNERGLFSKRNFDTNAIITIYGGKLVDDGVASQYVQRLSSRPRRFVDGRHFATQIAETPNDDGLYLPKIGAPDTVWFEGCGAMVQVTRGVRPNTRVVHFEVNIDSHAMFVPVIQATRAIAEGDELTRA
jgi:hypothetical protein